MKNCSSSFADDSGDECCDDDDDEPQSSLSKSKRTGYVKSTAQRAYHFSQTSQ